MLRILLLIGYSMMAVYASDEYINYPDVQQSYKLYPTPQQWFDAKNTCLKNDATLAMPKNEAEAEVLKNIFVNYNFSSIEGNSNPSSIFLGFHDMFKEGEYINTEGIPIQYFYHTWNQNQPDNNGNNEHCASMLRSGKLNDLPCNVPKPFVCQKNKKEVHNLTNPDCISSDPAYKYSNETNKCYKLHLNPKTWPEARTICQSEGGNLAIINSKTEEDFLVKMFTNSKDNVNHVTNHNYALIGFHDIFREGHFLTVEDDELNNIGYKNWQSGQPDNKDGRENCGSMHTSGGLNDFRCDGIAVFLCEIESKTLDYQLQPKDSDPVGTDNEIASPMIHYYPSKKDPGHFVFYYSSNVNA